MKVSCEKNLGEYVGILNHPFQHHPNYGSFQTVISQTALAVV